MSSRIRIGEGVRHGAELVRTGWRQAGLVQALSAVALTLFYGLQPSPTAEQPGSPLFILAILAYAPLAIAARGALYRLSLSGPGLAGQPLGPGGLQWSPVEWRLTRLALLFGFFILLIVLALVFVSAIMLVSMGVNESSLKHMSQAQAEALFATPQGMLLFVGMATFYIFGLWVWMRLSLASPATAASREVFLFETWPLTRGNYWRLLGGWLICLLPAMFAGMLLGAAFGEAAQGAVWAVGAASAMINAFVTLPLQTGFLAYAYERLAPEGGMKRTPSAQPDYNQRDDED